MRTVQSPRLITPRPSVRVCVPQLIMVLPYYTQFNFFNLIFKFIINLLNSAYPSYISSTNSGTILEMVVNRNFFKIINIYVLKL